MGHANMLSQGLRVNTVCACCLRLHVLQGVNPREGLPKLRADWVAARDAAGEAVLCLVEASVVEPCCSSGVLCYVVLCCAAGDACQTQMHYAVHFMLCCLTNALLCCVMLCHAVLCCR
jgi:hypothetical protein